MIPQQFDWHWVAAVVHKVRENFAELEERARTAADGQVPVEVARGLTDELHARLERELSDLLFSLCQLASWLGVSAEDSLRACTRRFVERFRRTEEQSARPLHELTDVELRAAWQKAKETRGPE